MQAIINKILWIRKNLLYVWFIYIICIFIYNYMSIYFDVILYHLVVWPYIIASLIGWTASQIYFLVFLIFFPDIIKIIKNLLFKLI